MLIMSSIVLSQSPQGFKYQAVCRDNGGNVLQDQSVGVRLSIRDGDPAGTIVYQETFAVVTNQFGLIMLDIGSGTVQSGDFASITWEAGEKFLEVELDTGTGYASMGTTQLLSVPYALHAESAGSLAGGETDPEVGTNALNYLSRWDGTMLVGSSIFDNGRIGIGTDNPFRMLHIVGTDGGLNSGLRIQDPYNVFLDFSVTNAPYGMQIYADQTSKLQFLIGGQSKMSIGPDGNIGIGTNEPSKKLTIADNAQVQSDGDWNPGATARLYLGPDDNMWIEHIHSGGLNLEVCNGWPFYIRNGGNVTMSIDGSGNVGIGTMTPSDKLDVWNGNIQVINGGVIANTGFWGDALRTNWGNDLTLQSSYEDRGIIFNTYSGEKMRIDAAGNVGLGTANPEFKLSLDSDGAILAKGTFGSGATLTTSGVGTRLIWYPRKSAFRAGYAEATEWDDENIGNHSFAVGFGTRASGDYSSALGFRTYAIGIYSTTFGNNTYATGNTATAMGIGTNASGDFSFAVGYNTTASGPNTTAMGRAINVVGSHSFGIGLNESGASITQDNTMAIMGGNVGIGTATPATLLDVNGMITATGGNSGNWNTAFSWGNHADAGYLTSVEDMTIGNEVTDATNATLVRSGAGTHVSPYTIALNLENTNIWTASQSFNANTYFPGTSVWTSSGQVGIGTINPGAGSKLEVWNGNITVLNGGVLANTGFWGDILRTNWGNDLTLQSSYADKGIAFRTQSGEKMRIDAAGNVGIGTNLPSSILHLIGDSPRLKIQTQTNLTEPSIELIKYGVRTMEIKLTDGGAGTGLQFIDQNSEQVRMYIKASTGMVGIGTIFPEATLDINGQVKISGGSPGAGKVLTSDETGLATWETPASAGSHYIGEAYGGGIIFYVYDNGQHGLIAASADISAGVQWYNGTDRYTGTTGDGLLAGAMNTALIVASQVPDNQTGSFAARLCADYSVTVGDITYGDWYLPSLFELSLLYLQKDAVGGFGTGRYWSSKEADNSPVNAWWINMGFGYTGGVAKSQANSVRPIRAF